jgi:hypothetical protein
MPKFNFYSAWMDPVFYLWGAVFAAALFALVYSIRRYLEIKNSGVFEEELPAEDILPGGSGEETPAEQPELPEPEPVPAAEPAPAAEAPQQGNRAETFVRGIYEGISGLDARMKAIEVRLSSGGGRANSDFAVKFLEDILQDYDTLDKTKIKARIEFLLSDLKK